MTFAKPFVALTALSFATLAHLACSSSSPPSAQQACSDLAKAECAQIAQCDGVTMGESWGNDQGQCATALSASCMTSNSFYGHGATPASVEACASATRAQSCANYDRLLAECVPPAGTLANGAPCSIPEQCAGGACYLSNTGSCGTCTQKSPLPAGTCAADTDCHDGQVCAGLGCSFGQVCTGHCLQPGGAGSACSIGSATANAGCERNMLCAVGDGGTSGTCVALPGKGQPCAGSAVLGGGIFASGCASGLVCNNQVCVAPTWVPLGGACPAPGLPIPSNPELCAGGACIRGVCVAYATAGSPCNGAESAPCAAGLECNGSVCVQPGNGVTCGVIGDGG